jgi:hypothetical protein
MLNFSFWFSGKEDGWHNFRTAVANKFPWDIFRILLPLQCYPKLQKHSSAGSICLRDKKKINMVSTRKITSKTAAFLQFIEHFLQSLNQRRQENSFPNPSPFKIKYEAETKTIGDQLFLIVSYQ